MVVVGPLNSSIRANLYISVISYKMVLAISTTALSKLRLARVRPIYQSLKIAGH